MNYVKAGIAGRKAVVIVEPDALPEASTKSCPELTPALVRDRVRDIRYASDRLSVRGTSVYLAAGNPTSKGTSAASLSFIVPLLISSQVARDAGFALNISSDEPTRVEQAYGDRVSKALAARGAPNKHYVVDTSRNGRGRAGNAAGAFCNLAGLGLGHVPSPRTSDPLDDAYLWIKYPGESDGKCRGAGIPDNHAPTSGVFWPAYAVGLVKGDSPAPAR